VQQVMWRLVVAEEAADGIRTHQGELKQTSLEAMLEAERMAETIENWCWVSAVRVVASTPATSKP